MYVTWWCCYTEIDRALLGTRRQSLVQFSQAQFKPAYICSVSTVTCPVEGSYNYRLTWAVIGPPFLTQCTCKTGEIELLTELCPMPQCFGLSLWEIMINVSIAEFSAQALSLSYFNTDFARWCCSYVTTSWHIVLMGCISVTISDLFILLRKKKENIWMRAASGEFTCIETSCLERPGPFESSLAYTCRSDSTSNWLSVWFIFSGFEKLDFMWVLVCLVCLNVF